MKSFIYKCFIGGSVALSMTLSSCLGDLDLKPIDDNVIQLSDFKDNPQYYTQLLAKVYAGLAVSGQEGPAGNPHLRGHHWQPALSGSYCVKSRYIKLSEKTRGYT